LLLRRYTIEVQAGCPLNLDSLSTESGRERAFGGDAKEKEYVNYERERGNIKISNKEWRKLLVRD
jgi:hypothetical protein